MSRISAVSLVIIMVWTRFLLGTPIDSHYSKVIINYNVLRGDAPVKRVEQSLDKKGIQNASYHHIFSIWKGSELS